MEGGHAEDGGDRYEDPDAEDHEEEDFLPGVALELVHHPHWQREDHAVGDDGEDGVRVPRVHQWVAISWFLLVPGLVDGDALEYACNDCRDSEERYYGKKRPAEYTVGFLWHNA